MKDFLIISLLVLAGGILLLSIIIMFISKKINIIKPRIVYIILVLFPIVVLVIPTLLVSPIKIHIVENFSLSILRCIYSLELLSILAIILIIVNMFPGSSFDNKKNIDYNFKKIASGVRLLQYSIFANILYIIPTLIFIIYAINFIYNRPQYAGETVTGNIYFILGWGTILMPSLAQVYAIAGSSIISIMTLAIIFFITSINGTIRITSVAVQNKKMRTLYMISMGLPVINIVSMLFLCYSAKIKLNT